MAIGYKSMGILNTGGLIQDNVCIGSYSGNKIKGRNNFCIGYYSGYDMINGLNDGRDNTYIGAWIGSNNKTGSENIFLGTVDKSITDDYLTDTYEFDQSFAVFKNNTLESANAKFPLMYSKILADKALTINNRTPAVGSENQTKLYINGAVAANSYTPFTGVHIVDLENEEDKDNIEEGLIISSIGEVRIKHILDTIVKVKVSVIQNDKKVYGIYAGYESRINVETKIKVGSVGEGMILVINYAGDIENGDYICSSGKGGYGMKQNDDILHSYTVAKATEDVIWDNINEYININGEQYKKFMVGCTYHCG